MGDLQIAVPVLAVFVLTNVWLCRRFRRAGAHVSSAYHVAAAIAMSLGTLTALTGIGHSAAVVSLALREPEYGLLQALRLTTGAMLIYSGAMGVALFRAIKIGQHSAIAVAAASASLFVLYLLVLLPVGGGDTVPPMLALWSIYLLSLLMAGFAALRTRTSRALQSPSPVERPQ